MPKGVVRVIAFLFAMEFVLTSSLFAATPAAANSTTTKKKSEAKITESSGAQKRITKLNKTRKVTRTSRKKRRYRRERFLTSSYADNVVEGDITAGEDPIVRAAAIEALGNMNGTVVAIDPDNGRILAMVNQKLALSNGAVPCSTIKVPVAFAALQEGLVTKDEEIKVSRRVKMNMTRALATSDNPYFQVLGNRLGYEKVKEYAHMFGLGELAGYEIEGEHPGYFPEEPISKKRGGVGRMSYYGDTIKMTPLQLAAFTAAIANGGTLYYLQHPQSQDEVLQFEPRVKRELDIAELIPAVEEGMLAAVEGGTGRSVRFNFIEEDVLGKTGTCSESGTRYGWFASYADTQYGRVVLAVMLQGGRPTYGPKAAEIAGRIYRSLYDHSYFASRESIQTEVTPASAPVVDDEALESIGTR